MHAELGEEVLIPGEGFEAEARAIPGTDSENQLPDESDAGEGTDGQDCVELPVGAYGADGTLGVPPEIGQEEENGQHHTLFLGEDGGAEQGDDDGHIAPVDRLGTPIEESGIGRAREHAAQGFGPAGDVGNGFGLERMEQEEERAENCEGSAVGLLCAGPFQEAADDEEDQQRGDGVDQQIHHVEGKGVLARKLYVSPIGEHEDGTHGADPRRQAGR